jgi:hypothetical protein
MARRALSKKEDIEAVPLTEPVDIDISEKAIVIEETDKGAITYEPEPKPEPEVVVAPEPPPKPEPTVEVKPDAALMRRLEEAENAVRLANQQLAQERAAREEARADAIQNGVDAVRAELESAKRDALAANTAGDTPQFLEATQRISVAAARLEHLEAGYAAIEKQRKEPPPAQRSADPIEALQVPYEAKTWLRKNPHFITNAADNKRLRTAHDAALDLENLTAWSPEYYEFVETKLGIRKAEPKPVPKSEPEIEERTVSAPVSRDAPSLSGGKAGSSKITLSPEEREHAKLAGVDEVTYAKMKQRLQREKQINPDKYGRTS